MKRTLIFIILIISSMGCSKSDVTPKEQDVWLAGYTALSSTSRYENASTYFYFFRDDSKTLFNYSPNGELHTLSEFYSLKDADFDLIRSGKAKTKNGEVVTATYDFFYYDKIDGMQEEKVLPGTYYVLACTSDVHILGIPPTHSLKYAGKYIEIKESSTPQNFTVVLPKDERRSGFIKWVSWNEKFDFDF